MFAKLKKAVSDAASRLDAAQQQTASRVHEAATRLDAATQQTATKAQQTASKVADKVPHALTSKLRRTSQPTLPVSPAAQARDSVRSSAAGDLIVHYQAHWRLVHANGQLQAKQRIRVDAAVHRTAQLCVRRAHALAAYRTAVDTASRDVRPAVDVLALDVASLCARVATLAAIVALAEREQSVHSAFARASELDLETFRKHPAAPSKRPAGAVAASAASLDDAQLLDVAAEHALESFLGTAAPAAPAEQEWSDEEAEPAHIATQDDDDDDDGYFGDGV
jgi:hypothetical protein